MKKVLITGFDPFGGESVNPAFEAVKKLPDLIAGAQVDKLEVPTVFHKSIDVLVKKLSETPYDVVICVGQAGGRFEITPERVAINVDDARIPDNEKNQPVDAKVFSDGESGYFSKLPVKAMVKAMKEANIPATVSNTAGTFVCNHLMYGLLYHINTNPQFGHIKGGFIHVPFIPEQVMNKSNTPSLTIDQLAKGLEICIQVALESDEDIIYADGKIS